VWLITREAMEKLYGKCWKHYTFTTLT
jgi:hypothetical protein